MMKRQDWSLGRFGWVVMACLIQGMVGEGLAQDKNAAKPAVAMPDIVVAPMRTATEVQSVPFMTYKIGEEPASLIRGTPETFDDVPSVMVQKTSFGQGSPFMRGFTGFRTLFMIDGIRLNNSTFRDGPNQYWNTVDSLSVESYEVMMGPASVLYGSDAIGGAVNAAPVAPPKEGTDTRLYYRGSTAERSNIGRVQAGAALGQGVSAVAGVSVKDFGDLEGGKDVGRQKNTGYEEQDGDLRLDWQISKDSSLTLGHQSVNQDDVWRTHKTIYGIDWEGLKVGDERVRTLDQERHLTWLKYAAANLDGVVDGVQVTLSRHAQTEDQYRVKKDYTGEYQGYDVETWGSGVQLQSGSPVGTWVYGMEYYRDGVDSYLRKFDETGKFKKPDIQGPVADDASYDSLGIYAQDTITGMFGGNLDVVPGVRYTYGRLDAGAVKDPVGGGKTSMNEDWDAVCGSLRGMHPLTPDREHVLFAGVSQGFRAPNLSDLTRLDTARSTEIETPVEELDPEYFTTCEAGMKTRVKSFSGQVAYYYTFIDQMIVRTPTGREIDGLSEVTKKNAGDGYVQGVEQSTRYVFNPQWSAWLAAAWMDGEVDAYPTSSPEKDREYISRVMPLTAHAGLRWQMPDGRFWAEAACEAAERADRLSADDERDTQRIPPGGTPGYVVFDVRAGARVLDHVDLTVGLENVADADYRIHGSGVNEPGRNLVAAVSSRF